MTGPESLRPGSNGSLVRTQWGPAGCSAIWDRAGPYGIDATAHRIGALAG
jgi:hypothetical protein